MDLAMIVLAIWLWTGAWVTARVVSEDPDGFFDASHGESAMDNLFPIMFSIVVFWPSIIYSHRENIANQRAAHRLDSPGAQYHQPPQ